MSREVVNNVMKSLEEIFPDCALALIIAPFKSPPGARANWASNANRQDMIALLKEMVAHLEGRRHDGPETKQ